ncbi:HPr family phosphocarrier protein [Priestia megaterium]|uniref:HPr family phosphocarrier protein n=1 Tax=Priestia megaterium TaxID=1404 RepID=UPI002452C5D4|nr:HPr family phosphocarrier protein [Priestia megaterium]MDH3183556.1 HPr family phosphocarrier protein [Priestia megaterium]MDH3183596.1 HPr family phosphocarrier protein [Priestia megaterium]
MLKKRIVVGLEHGLQARYATEFVQKASTFESDIILMKNGVSIAAKSIMGVMCIAIRKKEDITLFADGIDEQAAVKNLETFLLNKQ